MSKFGKDFAIIGTLLNLKQKSKEKKRNRALDCGGLGSSLGTGSSIPFNEARRHLVIVLLLHFLIC